MRQSSTTGIVVQYSRPKVGGIEYGRPWTGGHRDPLKIEPEPMSPYCWRTQEMEQKTFKRVEEGVKDSWKLKKKEDLLNVKSEFWRDLQNLGLESVFYYEDSYGVFHNVFENPDSASLRDLRQWETTLRLGCKYDKKNLNWGRQFIQNSISDDIDKELRLKIQNTDGSVVYWHYLSKHLQGAVTSKMIGHEKIIKETKLTDFPGLNVSKFHEKLRPSLITINELGDPPLNVGGIVIKNHLGPSDIAFKGLVQRYASDQALLTSPSEQYPVLLRQMDTLEEIFINSTEWEQKEKHAGAYVGLEQSQPKKKGCFKCGSPKHKIKDCPQWNKDDKTDDKKFNKDKRSNKSDNAGFWKKPNDLSEVKKVNGKDFHWCKHCNHGKGFWRTHKAEDCRFNKKKKEEKESSSSNSDTGGSSMLVMDIVDAAFLGMMS